MLYGLRDGMIASVCKTFFYTFRAEFIHVSVEAHNENGLLAIPRCTLLHHISDRVIVRASLALFDRDRIRDIYIEYISLRSIIMLTLGKYVATDLIILFNGMSNFHLIYEGHTYTCIYIDLLRFLWIE